MSNSASSVSELFATHGPKLLAFIDRRLPAELRKRMEAADILQLAYAKAQTDLPRYRAQAARPSEYVWLYSVVRDTLHAEWRKATRKVRDARRDMPLPEHSSVCLIPADSGVSPSGALIRVERAAQVQQVLALLSADYREALLMHVVDELTFAQIGEFTGATANNAAVRCHRAMKKFREHWNAHFASSSRRQPAYRRVPRRGLRPEPPAAAPPDG